MQRLLCANICLNACAHTHTQRAPKWTHKESYIFGRVKQAVTIAQLCEPCCVNNKHHTQFARGGPVGCGTLLYGLGQILASKQSANCSHWLQEQGTINFPQDLFEHSRLVGSSAGPIGMDQHRSKNLSKEAKPYRSVAACKAAYPL